MNDSLIQKRDYESFSRPEEFRQEHDGIYWDSLTVEWVRICKHGWLTQDRPENTYQVSVAIIHLVDEFGETRYGCQRDTWC